MLSVNPKGSNGITWKNTLSTESAWATAHLLIYDWGEFKEEFAFWMQIHKSGSLFLKSAILFIFWISEKGLNNLFEVMLFV